MPPGPALAQPARRPLTSAVRILMPPVGSLVRLLAAESKPHSTLGGAMG